MPRFFWIGLVAIGIVVVAMYGQQRANDRATFTPGGVTTQPLADQMNVTMTSCTGDQATGTLRNDSFGPVNISLNVEFTDSTGTRLDQGLAATNGLAAGQTWRWTAYFLGQGSVAHCRVTIGYVLPA